MSDAGRILVVDVGTSSVRAVVHDADGTAIHGVGRPLAPETPADGLVEFDAALMATTCLELAITALEAVGPVAAVGVSNQRGSTVVWDRATGRPVGPGLGWQDLRTVGDCLVLRGEGLRVAPNQSATKAKWLLDQAGPDARDRDLCVGTVDAWIVHALSGGSAHVTDASNAAITGLLATDADTGWDATALAAVGVPPTMMPTVVDSAGIVAEARALPGAPPIAAIIGDQQASLVGQGCVRPGPAKITFGTGGMLDLVVDDRPTFAGRGSAGTFPIVARRVAGELTWGVEAIMLAAGTNVQWLCDDLGLAASPAETHELAAACADTGGVVFVPALLGLGTPHWDYGARGTLLGLTRGSGRAEIVRAVLEGVAHRGADLVEAAETDTGRAIPVLRVDGGMTDNPTFVQALADAAQRPVEVSPVREATAKGAALLAALAVGLHDSIDDLAATWAPRARIEPTRTLDRDRWRDAVARSTAWIPELSGIDF
ncbi:MAG: FGGY family carbohydrate kinase [Actinomycetota bacterium]